MPGGYTSSNSKILCVKFFSAVVKRVQSHVNLTELCAPSKREPNESYIYTLCMYSSTPAGELESSLFSIAVMKCLLNLSKTTQRNKSTITQREKRE